MGDGHRVWGYALWYDGAWERRGLDEGGCIECRACGGRVRESEPRRRRAGCGRLVYSTSR